jgi:hypothetical protein
MKSFGIVAFCAVFTFAVSVPAVAAGPSGAMKAQYYALGVEMGFASVHSVAAANGRSVDNIRAMKALVVADIFAIEPLATSIAQAGGPQLAPLNTADLDFVSQNAISITDARNDFSNVSNSIVSARDGMTASLSKTSPVDTNAYLLGVNIGIAEA